MNFIKDVLTGFAVLAIFLGVSAGIVFLFATLIAWLAPYTVIVNQILFALIWFAIVVFLSYKIGRACRESNN